MVNNFASKKPVVLSRVPLAPISGALHLLSAAASAAAGPTTPLPPPAGRARVSFTSPVALSDNAPRRSPGGLLRGDDDTKARRSGRTSLAAAAAEAPPRRRALDSKTMLCKVLVVGNAKCGKTSIIRRFASGAFDAKYSTTVRWETSLQPWGGGRQ